MLSTLFLAPGTDPRQELEVNEQTRPLSLCSQAYPYRAHLCGQLQPLGTQAPPQQPPGHSQEMAKRALTRTVSQGSRSSSRSSLRRAPRPSTCSWMAATFWLHVPMSCAARHRSSAGPASRYRPTNRCMPDSWQKSVPQRAEGRSQCYGLSCVPSEFIC